MRCAGEHQPHRLAAPSADRDRHRTHPSAHSPPCPCRSSSPRRRRARPTWWTSTTRTRPSPCRSPSPTCRAARATRAPPTVRHTCALASTHEGWRHAPRALSRCPGCFSERAPGLSLQPVPQRAPCVRRYPSQRTTPTPSLPRSHPGGAVEAGPSRRQDPHPVGRLAAPAPGQRGRAADGPRPFRVGQRAAEGVYHHLRAQG